MKTHRKNVEGAYCPPNTASSWLESRGGRARDGGAEGQVSDRPRLRGRKGADFILCQATHSTRPLLQACVLLGALDPGVEWPGGWVRIGRLAGCA